MFWKLYRRLQRLYQCVYGRVQRLHGHLRDRLCKRLHDGVRKEGVNGFLLNGVHLIMRERMRIVLFCWVHG